MRKPRNFGYLSRSCAITWANFADELDEAAFAEKLWIESLAAKEALQTIKILIPKLRTAQGRLATGSPQMAIRECLNCE